VKTARGVYWQQKNNARRRGIPWEFTFDSWWKLWQESGHWEQRGNKPGRYCCGRHGDAGPYNEKNCSIILFEDNLKAARLIIRRYTRRSTVVTYK
jgi:hypothetical protein